MLAKDLVSNSLPPLKTSDTGSKALTWMNEFHCTHLPIVDGEKFSSEIVAIAMKVAERRLMTLDEIVDNPKSFESLVSDKEWDVIGYDELSA